jgi:hypothetical protein
MANILRVPFNSAEAAEQFIETLKYSTIWEDVKVYESEELWMVEATREIKQGNIRSVGKGKE